MPKTPSNKLFQLIKSLSGSEKRYFKLFINQGGGKTNKYVQLFDAIDTQSEFDDEALKAVVYVDEPIQSRKYSELKSYLYDSILKSLQFYDEKSSVDFKLKSMLQSVRVLFKRSLYEDCLDILQKAKKLAYKYEQYNVIIEILTWEKDIAYAKSDIDFLDQKLKAFEQEENFCLTQLQLINTYRNLFLKLLIGLRKNTVRSEKWAASLNQSIDAIKVDSIEEIKSQRARILYYRVFAFYYYSNSDNQKFYETNRSLVEVMETNKYLLQEDLSEYISTLSNLSMSSGKLGKFDEVLVYLEKFKKLKPNTFDDELKIHRQYYTIKFQLCITKGDFEEGLRELKHHLAEVKKFDETLFERNSFYFQYFYICYGAEEYDKALEYLNHWLSLPKTVERQDLQAIARILNLIIHYEIGNHLLLDSLLRSTYRFLNKRNSLHLFERRMVSFIREANKIQDKRALQSAFEELKEDFDKLQSKGAEKAMLQIFDFEAWLRSKIERKSFAQVVRENYERSMAAAS